VEIGYVRITNSILHHRSLAGLQEQLEGIERAQRKIASGLEVQRPSDDPVSTGPIMRASSALRALEQHRRNISAGTARLAAEESVLEQADDTLVRAKELAIGQSGGTGTTATRAAAAGEVRSLLDHVQDLANTVYGGSYLFGGDYTDRPPFPDGGPDPAAPPSGSRRIEVAPGSTVETNHDAQEIFFDSGVVDALDELATALAADDAEGVRDSISSLDGAFDEIQELLAEVGARSRRMDIAESNSDALEVNLRSLRSDLRDADLEQAVTELVNRQTGYQAAMLANARILQSTLTDYL
jgi:flagellar hook-associated protein 3 FlgL